MADIAELGYKVDSRELTQAERALDRQATAAKRAETASERLERQHKRNIEQAKAFGAVLGTIGVALAIGVIRNTIEAEKVQAQLAAALKSTAGASGQTIASLNEHAGALQKVTAYGDEAIGTAQGVLLTFTKIGGETFPKATEAVLDMATAMQMDLKSASIQVGKALNDPVLGVTALGRAGVQFSEDQKEMIRSLVETGDVAGAQVIILKELETQFGGSARAARDTLGGALESLKNAFGDLLEGDSGSDGVRGAKDAIEQLTGVMQDQQTKQAFSSLISLVAGLTAEMVNGVAIFANYLAKAAEMRALATGNATAANTGTDALNQRLAQVEERRRKLADRNIVQQGMAGLPTNWLLDAAGEDAGAQAAREAAGGFNPYNQQRELAFLEKERTRLIREISAANRRDLANESGGSSGSPNGRGPSARGSAPEAIDAATQKTIDKLREEAEAYGLSKSALLEREKAQAMAAASNDAERQALGGSYDALIAVVRAEEQAKESKSGIAKATRDAARADRESAQALSEFTRITEDMRAELEGPVAQVKLDYQRKEQELLALADLAKLSDQERATALGLLTQARERDIAATELQMKLDAEQLGPREQLFADLDREIELLKMGRIERETELALERMLFELRQQGINLTPQEIDAARQRIDAKLEEIDAIQRQIAAMDEFRSNFANSVTDVLTGSKSAKDALLDLVDSFIEQMARMASQNLTGSIFGQPGTTGGGMFGDLFGSLLSAFGGGRAYGGDVRGDKFYEVGEGNRPEMANIGGRQFLIPGNRGRVEPISQPSQGRSAPMRGGDTFIVQGATSRRALERMRADRDRADRNAARSFS